jgi:hypothetical protein
MKQRQLQCPQALVDVICQAIELYAAAAYPPGGSECAQAAREALRSAAQSLVEHYNPQTETTHMSRRILSHVKAALEYYFAQSVAPSALQLKQRELVFKALSGQVVTRQQWGV